MTDNGRPQGDSVFSAGHRSAGRREEQAGMFRRIGRLRGHGMHCWGTFRQVVGPLFPRPDMQHASHQPCGFFSACCMSPEGTLSQALQVPSRPVPRSRLCFVVAALWQIGSLSLARTPQGRPGSADNVQTAAGEGARTSSSVRNNTAGAQVLVTVGIPVPISAGRGPTSLRTMAGIFFVAAFLRSRLYMMVPDVWPSSTSKIIQSGRSFSARAYPSVPSFATVIV